MSTRFICSSNPYIYWFIAKLTQIEFKKYKLNSIIDLIRVNNEDKRLFSLKLIYLYFIIYVFIGTLLFVNFLPFT